MIDGSQKTKPHIWAAKEDDMDAARKRKRHSIRDKAAVIVGYLDNLVDFEARL